MKKVSNGLKLIMAFVVIVVAAVLSVFLHYQHVRMKKLRLRNQEVVIQKNCLHFPLKKRTTYRNNLRLYRRRLL